VSIQGAGGPEGDLSASVTASGGIAYTFEDPIWREDFSPAVGKGLRIALGLYKVMLGVAHGNPIAIVRDAAGLVGGVEEVLGVELTDPIVNFLIPMPESA
jgi:hypothetical protein